MMKVRRLATMLVCFCLAVYFSASLVSGKEPPPENPATVTFFDVLDLPARIDEPKLLTTGDNPSLTCGIANRSGEKILGLRLILLIVDSSGKLRSRVTWNEAAEIPGYSIKQFEFQLDLKPSPNKTDKLFLAIDAVASFETIWHTVDAEKALRAYSRGQHDVTPTVRKVANKYDPKNPLGIIW